MLLLDIRGCKGDTPRYMRSASVGLTMRHRYSHRGAAVQTNERCTATQVSGTQLCGRAQSGSLLASYRRRPGYSTIRRSGYAFMPTGLTLSTNVLIACAVPAGFWTYSR